jgi:hypothetical protein
MAEVLLPPRTRVASSAMKYVDSTGAARAIYTGSLETTAFGGDRLGATLTLSPVGGLPASERVKRARLLAAIVGLRGKQNRIWMPDHSYTQRGSFPAAELMQNGFFADGSLWSPINAPLATVYDGVMRIMATAAGSQVGIQSSSMAVTANAPYVSRAFLRVGRGDMQPSVVPFDGAIFSVGGGPGLATAVLVPTAATMVLQIKTNPTSGFQAGDFFECPFASLARCALADGGPNLLLHSDTPGGTSWGATNVTAAVSGTDPIGLTTAYALTETTANGNHLVGQSAAVPAAAGDCSLSMYVKKGIRSFCQLVMTETTGSTQLSCSFDLNSGTVGATQVTGANWTNPRYFVEACGGGWFRVTLIGRKTNAATTISCFVLANTTDGIGGYVGSTSGVALSVWRASFSASSFPTRATQTVAAAAASANDAAGYVYLKGLPPSTAGLLLPGDQVQIGKQLTFVTSSLDSNEAGLGYLQISPPLRYSPADNDAVIIVHPMGRFVFSGDYPAWDNQPGVFMTSDLEFEEDCRVS